MRRAAFGLLLALAIPAAAQPTAHGVVLDGARAPLAGARVELLPVFVKYEQWRRRLAGQDPAAPVAQTVTDSAGRFLLRSEGAGVFAVRIAAPGKVPIQLDPLALTGDVELPPAALPDDAGARLVFKTAQKSAAAGLWVFAEGFTQSQGKEPTLDGWRLAPRVGRTAADGTLQLSRLAGEELQVHAFTREGLEVVYDRIVGGDLACCSPPAGVRALRVLAASGRPVSEVLIRLGDAAWPIVLTDREGRAAIPFARETDRLRLRLVSADGRQTLVYLNTSGGEDVTLTDRSPLTGRVVREEDRRPLAGALVWSVADPGDFQLSDPEGRYRAAVSKTDSLWLECTSADRQPKRIALEAARFGSGRAPAIALARSGAVAGRVIDPAGGAVAGAWVQALAAGKPAGKSAGASTGALSRADGRFEIAGLKPAELYSLQATKNRFLPGSGSALVAPAGARGAPVTLVLAPVRAAVGRVVDARKRPVAGAEIRLFAQGSSTGPHQALRGGETAVSDGSGRFRVGAVPALAIDVEVSRRGYARTSVRNFKLAPGAGPVDLGTVTLWPGVPLSGVVVDEQRRPIAGASVFQVEELRPPEELRETARDRLPDAATDAAGAFSLPDLRAGRPVHLLVFAPGTLAVTKRGLQPPVPAPLRIPLTAGTELHGRVLDPEGAPVPGAAVAVSLQPTLAGRDDIPIGRPISKRASADHEGRFHLKELPVGKARLSVSAPGFIAIDDQPVLLSRLLSEDKTVVLRRGSTLEGRVVTTVGAPVAGAKIRAGSASGVSDDDGAFQVTGVPPGALVVEAVHPHFKRFRQSVRIEAGVNHLDVELDAGAVVRGRVVDGQAQPVPGAIASLAVGGRSAAYQARTDGEGVFVMEDVAPGRYTLKASASGFADAESPAAVVVRHEAVDGLEVELGQGGAITGRVLGLPSDELPQVTIHAVNDGAGSRVATPDAAGNYELRDLRAGAWLVQASLLDGRKQARTRVLLKAGAEETRDLRFGDGLTLSGWVLYRDQPLADARMSLRGQHLAVERSITTGYDGGFRFEDLDADSYWLGLRQDQVQVAENEMVELASDRELTIRLARQTVAGSVTDTAGGPIASALVALRHIAGEEGPEFLMADGTDPSGAFAVERVPPGHYQMTVNHAGFSPAEREVEVPDGHDVAGLEVELQKGQGLELVVRRAGGGAPGLLNLRVQSPSGAPILAETRPVGSDGAVRLSSLPAGSWLLLAASSNSALTSFQVAVPSDPVEIVLPSAARIAVHVPQLATSDSIASLTVSAATGGVLRTLSLGGTLEQQWPLIAGEAAVAGVPAGTWIVSATAPDGRTWSAPVTTDGRTDVQISLE